MQILDIVPGEIDVCNLGVELDGNDLEGGSHAGRGLSGVVADAPRGADAPEGDCAPVGAPCRPGGH